MKIFCFSMDVLYLNTYKDNRVSTTLNKNAKIKLVLCMHVLINQKTNSDVMIPPLFFFYLKIRVFVFVHTR